MTIIDADLATIRALLRGWAAKPDEPRNDWLTACTPRHVDAIIARLDAAEAERDELREALEHIRGDR